VTAAQPELATPEVVESLVALLVDPDVNVRGSAVEVLRQMTVERPELITTQVMESLVTLLADPDMNVRGSAASAIERAVAKRPELITTQVLESLVNQLADPDNIELRAIAADTIGEVVDASPGTATPKVAEALTNLLIDYYEVVRTKAGQALTKVYAHQALQAEVTHQSDLLDTTLFPKLIDPLNSLERPIVARAIFIVALHDSDRNEMLQSRLKELSSSHRPIDRIWANTTLQMLDLAAMAHTAAKDETQRAEIISKLEEFAASEYEKPFGSEFTWAAREARVWLYWSR
jgi:HEAT repeat protein